MFLWSFFKKIHFSFKIIRQIAVFLFFEKKILFKIYHFLTKVLGICFAEQQFMNAILHFSQLLQNQCRNIVQSSSSYSDLAEGFLCGINATHSTNFSVFQQLGLIHLLVVSGSHLIMVSHFLEMCLAQIPHQFLKKTLLILFIFFYLLMTGMQPPLMRAFISFLLKEFSDQNELHWPKTHLCLFSGFICLFIFPDWIISLSFYLSWLTTLSFSFPTPSPIYFEKLFKSKYKFIFQILQHLFINWIVQILLTPLIGHFSFVALICNFLFASILSFFLWPLSFLTLFSNINEVRIAIDFIWQNIFAGLQFFFKSSNTSSSLLSLDGHWTALWIGLLSIQFYFIYTSFHLRRGQLK